MGCGGWNAVSAGWPSSHPDWVWGWGSDRMWESGTGNRRT